MSKSSVRDLRVERVSLTDLVLDPRNARVHSDLQIGQITRSIETFGFNVPILIDANNKVCCLDTVAFSLPGSSAASSYRRSALPT